MAELPPTYRRFLETYPDTARAYQALGQAVSDAGPLEAKTRELVKLGISIGSGSEGAVHSHTRRAREAGATDDEIRHVALLALTSIGFPHMMAALTWVEDVLGHAEPEG